MLSFLRGDEPSTATAPLTPQPQLAQLRALAAQRTGLGLAIELDDRLGGSLPPSATQATAYRIVQEALTNVVRHSAASRATIVLDRDAGDLVVTVADDGSGMPADAPERGGLRGMRERAELIDGSLSVAAAPAAAPRSRHDCRGARRRDPGRPRRRPSARPGRIPGPPRLRARHRGGRRGVRRVEALLRTLRTTAVDVALLDIRMPDGDGLWTTEQIAADPALAAREGGHRDHLRARRVRRRARSGPGRADSS